MAHLPNGDEKSSRTSSICHRCFTLRYDGVAPAASVSDEESTIFLGSPSFPVHHESFQTAKLVFCSCVWLDSPVGLSSQAHAHHT